VSAAKFWRLALRSIATELHLLHLLWHLLVLAWLVTLLALLTPPDVRAAVAAAMAAATAPPALPLLV
jgi:hypothetical protein